MKSRRIISAPCKLVLVIQLALLGLAPSAFVEARYVELAARTSGAPTTASTTTDSPLVASLEDPSNSETTDPNNSAEDDLCNRCYEHVQSAQSLIEQHTNLVMRQKRLIQRKINSSSSSSNTATKKPRRSTNSVDVRQVPNPGSPASPTGSVPASSITRRTFDESNIDSNTIVVSRLRVARAAVQDEIPQSQIISKLKLAASKVKKDKELEQIRAELKQVLNETCNTLDMVKDCMEETSQECTGNLHFHSLELFADQYYARLRCPYKSNPKLKQIFMSTRAWPEERVPTARPISSKEEVRKRLDKLFPDGNRGPFGVMLKPTLTSSGYQQFNSIGTNEQQFGQHTKGGQWLQVDQRVGAVSYGPQQLVVPCFLVLTIALLLLSIIYLSQLPLYRGGEEEEEDEHVRKSQNQRFNN